MFAELCLSLSISFGQFLQRSEDRSLSHLGSAVFQPSHWPLSQRRSGRSVISLPLIRRPHKPWLHSQLAYKFTGRKQNLEPRASLFLDEAEFQNLVKKLLEGSPSRDGDLVVPGPILKLQWCL